MATFFRPDFPYTNKPLPNDKRFQTLSLARTPPSASTLDAELNYVADSLNQLQVAIDGVAAGAIQGSDDPANIGKFPVTDGASHIDWVKVTTPYLTDACVTQEKLGPQCVGTAQYEDGSLPAAAIPDGSLPGTKLLDNAITSGKLADNAVITTKIADNAVTAAKIIDGAVTSGKLATNAVTTAKIDTLAVTTAKIASGAVTTAKIASGAVTTGEIAAGAVTTGEIAAGAVSRVKLNADLSKSVMWAGGIFRVIAGVVTLFVNRRNIASITMDSNTPQLQTFTVLFTEEFDNGSIIPHFSIQCTSSTDPFPSIVFDGAPDHLTDGLRFFVRNPVNEYNIYFSGVA